MLAHPTPNRKMMMPSRNQSPATLNASIIATSPPSMLRMWNSRVVTLEVRFFSVPFRLSLRTTYSPSRKPKNTTQNARIRALAGRQVVRRRFNGRLRRRVLSREPDATADHQCGMKHVARFHAPAMADGRANDNMHEPLRTSRGR